MMEKTARRQIWQRVFAAGAGIFGKTDEEFAARKTLRWRTESGMTARFEKFCTIA